MCNQCEYAANGDLNNLMAALTSRYLLDGGYGFYHDPNSHSNKNISNPLWHAARHGHSAIVSYLLSDKNPMQKTVLSTIDARDSKNGTTALYQATEYGHLDIIKLLETGKAQYQSVEDGSTPLSIAAKYNRVSVVEYFLNNDNYHSVISNNDLQLALHEAVENGHTNIVKLLLTPKQTIQGEQKTDPSFIIPWDALYLSAQHGNLKIVTLLADAGATYITKKDESTPLSVAARNGHSDVVEYFLNSNCRQIISNNDLRLTLREAVENGRTNIVKLLLTPKQNEQKDEKKADYTISTNGGNNLLLSIAAQKGHETLVKYFLSDEYKKIDNTNINARSGKNSTTALYEASAQGHFNIVKELLAAGASPNICANDMTFPLENVLKNKHYGIAAYLLLYGATVNPTIEKLIIKNKSDITDAIINIGLDESFSKKDDLRILHVNLLKRIGIILDGKENNVDSCLQAAFFAKRNTFGKTPRVTDGKSCVSHLNIFYKNHLQKYHVSAAKQPEEKHSTSIRPLNLTTT